MKINLKKINLPSNNSRNFIRLNSKDSSIVLSRNLKNESLNDNTFSLKIYDSNNSKCNINHKPNNLFEKIYMNKMNNELNSKNQFSSISTTIEDKIKKKSVKNTISFDDKNFINKKDRVKLKDFSTLQKNKIKRKKPYRSSASFESFLNQEKKFTIKSKNKSSKFRKVNYKLKDLIEFEPYHLLNKGVKDSIKMYTEKNEKFKYPNIRRNVKTASGNSLSVLKTNSIFVNKNTNNILLIKRLMKVKNKTYPELEYLIKWVGIYHLWDKHVLIINCLLENFFNYKWFIDENKYLSYDKFTEFLNTILKESSTEIDYSCFLEDIYLLFSFNKKTTNIKKLYSTFVITHNNILYKDKIDFLCNIWENKNSDEINIKILLFYIKNNLKLKSDYQKISLYFNQNYKIDSNLTKKQIYNLFVSDKKLRFYFERNCQINYEKINKLFHEMITEFFLKKLNNFETKIHHYETQIQCPKEIDNLEKFLEIIDNKLETKKSLKTILNE